MYENIVIDDTSVYEIDEQCIRCKQRDINAIELSDSIVTSTQIDDKENEQVFSI